MVQSTFALLIVIALPDPYLMTQVNDFIDCLGKAIFKAKFDLANGFLGFVVGLGMPKNVRWVLYNCPQITENELAVS